MEATFDFPATITRLGVEKPSSVTIVCVVASLSSVYKLQYIEEPYKTRPELITEFEISQEIKALRDHSKRPDLLVIKAFFTFDGATVLSPAARFRLQKACPQFYDRINKKGWGRGVLNVISMERAPQTLEDLYDRKEVFSKDFLQNLTKQLVLALDFLRERLDFVHADLKPDNILAFGDAPEYRFKIFDFGTSSTARVKPFDNYRWLVPPILLLEVATDSDLRAEIRGRNRRGDDVWAVGLLLLQLAVRGLDVREYEHVFKTPDQLLTPQRPQRLLYKTLLDVVPQNECFDNLVEGAIIAANDERERNEIFHFAKHLLVVCQVQNYLGNGFVPKDNGEQYNAYFDVVRENADDILDSNRKRPAEETSCSPVDVPQIWDYETEPSDIDVSIDENNDDKNTNIFELFVAVLFKKVGVDGLDFVRRCLQWTTEERRKFWEEESEVRDFDALLEHPFLRTC